MAGANIGDFDLIIPKEAERTEVELGSEITIPCRLSNGAHFDDAIEIKWFKETELVCHYKNRQVIQGKKFENRVSMSIEEINGGNVSVSLKDFSQSDFGDYLCEVTCGDRKKEITIKIEDFTEWKKQRNKKIVATVGAIAAVALPGIGLAGLTLGAMAAAVTAAVGVVTAGTAAALMIVFQIIFLRINRPWSEEEREKMTLSFMLTVPVRRSSNELGHPSMSGETT